MTAHRQIRVREALLLFLALVLFASFCTLGTWQLQRRAWKLDLITHVETQLAKAPVPAPGPGAWPSISRGQEYLPVTVSGHFLHGREALVQAMTRYGSGYWLLTPLTTDRGFVILVNRGFLQAEQRDPATRREAQPAGRVELTGLLRLTEPDGRVLQANDPGADRWYSRDVRAIGATRGLEPQTLAPYFVDAGEASNSDGGPIGGLTVVHFRNPHLGYALTWYTLALMTALGTWLALRERSKPEALAADIMGDKTTAE